MLFLIFSTLMPYNKTLYGLGQHCRSAKAKAVAVAVGFQRWGRRVVLLVPMLAALVAWMARGVVRQAVWSAAMKREGPRAAR